MVAQSQFVTSIRVAPVAFAAAISASPSTPWRASVRGDEQAWTSDSCAARHSGALCLSTGISPRITSFVCGISSLVSVAFIPASHCAEVATVFFAMAWLRLALVTTIIVGFNLRIAVIAFARNALQAAPASGA